MKQLAVILALIACVLPGRAGTPVAAAGEERLGLWRLVELPWNNPALNRLRMSGSLTRAGARYTRTSHGDAYDPRFGSGEQALSAGAATYTKLGSSTLWGEARYYHGKARGVVWNESSDYDIVYPYVTADSIGGDISGERYFFGGGYADCKGRLAWGAGLSYTATLACRSVDPRPKNVSGCLDAAAGMAFRAAGYEWGISLNFRKYKQSNDISFKGEMGVDKIFHLTGAGTDYRRFAGTGLSTYYDGYRYGMTADIYPSGGSGFMLSADMSVFTFDNIIADFNKLPLASVWHKTVEAEAAWLDNGRAYGGYALCFGAYRRHGSENIFGDAAGGIYPPTGSNAMYADNGTHIGARVLRGLCFGTAGRVAVEARAGWRRRITTYVEPWRQSLVNTAYGTLRAGVSAGISAHWLLGAEATVGIERPFGCRMDFTDAGTDAETAALEAIERRAFDRAASPRTEAGARLSAARSTGKSCMLEIAAEIQRHTRSLSLSLIF